MRPLVPAAVAMATLALAWSSACSSAGPSKATLPPAGGATSTTAVAGTSTTTTVDLGALPQTRQEPGGQDPQLLAGAQSLWQAIVGDHPALAMPFFFPRSAYLQVKAIADPAHDWQTRLVAAYEQDIHALHATLGPGVASADYAGVTVPASAARWVNPGEEYNRLGYWRVYGATLDYSVGGRARSITIASLISWRGEWYVVHLRFIR